MQGGRPGATSRYERFDICRRDCGVLHRQRTLRPVLRKTVGAPMETVIVGLVALLLFIYLFMAMIRPEKF
jgi:K+-transporting ATPase KdpF subunit